MVKIGEKKGIRVVVHDLEKKSSKSFTVYDISFDKIYYNILYFVKQLKEFKKISLICYRGDK